MSFAVHELAASVVESGRVWRYAGVWTIRMGLAWVPGEPPLTAELDQLHAAGAIAVDRDGFVDPQTC
jgi:hypothetical protein